jgi:hypothetical protein
MRFFTCELDKFLKRMYNCTMYMVSSSTRVSCQLYLCTIIIIFFNNIAVVSIIRLRPSRLLHSQKRKEKKILMRQSTE